MDLKIAYSPNLSLKDSHVAIYKIYVLKDPFSNEVFYVGQTFQELSGRLSGHISDAGASNQTKKQYIKEIIERGSKPIIEAVETIRGTCYIDKLFVNDREIFWVKYYKSKGVKLLNAALMHDDAECKDFRSYLRHIKEGQTEYRFYYCGTTHGGHAVYDEARMNLDGFILPKNDAPESVVIEKPKVKVVEKIVERVIYRTLYTTIYEKRPTIKTDTFPEQPGWTSEFAAGIPYSDDLIDEFDFEEDASDWEDDMSDYEPDIEEADESDYEPEDDDFEPGCDEEESQQPVYQ